MRGDVRQSARRLAAELRAESANLARVVAEALQTRNDIGERAPTNVELYAVGGMLHAFYTGLERSFSRVAIAFDGGVPEGGDWHQRLLSSMTLELPETRPAVLRVETARVLDEFLAFRHKFRHLYLFDLDWKRLDYLLTQLPAAWSNVNADLEAVTQFVDRLAIVPGG